MSEKIGPILPILALLETTFLARLRQIEQALKDTQLEIEALQNDWNSPSARPEETLEFLISGSGSKYQTWHDHRLAQLRMISLQQLEVVAQTRAEANIALGRHLIGKEIARKQLNAAKQVASRQ